MKKSLFLSTLISAVALSVPAWAGDPSDGSGTADSPYSGTVSDWDLSSTTSSDTIYISGLSGYWASGSKTFAANLVINGDGLTINNGYSGGTYTFAGDITGSGAWTHTTSQDQKYTFTGSLAGYSGTINFTGGDGSYFHFGNGSKAATDTNASGTGSITVNGNVTYNYSDYASSGSTAITIGNTSITAATVEFAGSVNYAVSNALSGYNNGGTLTISNVGHTTTLNGATSGFTTVTVNEGSTLAVGSTGSLDLSSTTVNIGSTIQNSGTVILDTSTTFVIDGLGLNYTGDWENGATYTLITDVGSGTIEGYGDLTITNVSSATSTINTASFSLDNGSLTVTVTGTFVLADGLHGDGLTASSAYVSAGGSASSILTVTFDVGNFTEKGTTVYLATDSYALGSVYENIYWSNSFTANCDIVIGAAGVYLTNGGSSEVHNFTGAISGDGSLTVGYYGTGDKEGSTVAQHYGFTGNLSGWNGDITITTSNAYDYLIFGGTIDGANSNGTLTGITATQAATNTSVSGTGAISVDYGVVEYVYTAGANGQTGETLTVTNSSIEAHQIIFTGGVNYDVSSNLIGWDNSSGTSSADSTLTISNTGTTTFSGSVSNFDNVTVASGSTLAIASTGSLDLSSTTVTLASAISNSGTITVDGDTSFVIDGIEMGTGGGTGNRDYYIVIAGEGGSIVDGNTLTIDNFTLSEGTLEGTWGVYSDNGYLVIYGEEQTTAGKEGSDLTWNGTDSAFTWNTNSENAIWNDTETGESGYYFTNGNDVTFGATGANTNVTVEGEVTAGSTTINGAYTFAIGADASVTTGTLTIAEGGSLALTGEGKIVTGAASNSTALAFDASGFTGEMDFTKGYLDIANSTFNSGATVVVTANTNTTHEDGYLSDTDVSLHIGNAESNSTSEFAASLVLEGDGGVIIRTGDSTKTVTFLGSVTGTNATLQLNGGGNAVFSGTVNVGTYLNFQGATTFSGATTLGKLEFFQNGSNASDVTFTGSAAQATVTALVVDQSGGSGTATLTVSDGASLSVGTMTIDHDLAITIDSAAMSITTSVTQASGTSTSVTISNGGTLALGEDVSLNVDVMNIVLGEANLSSSGVYVITGESSSSLTLTDSALITITVSEAIASLLSQEGTYSFNIYEGLSLSTDVFDIQDILNYSTDVTWSNGVLTVVVGSGAIPEPSMFGVFFGLGAIGLVATRRRRRRKAA